MLSRNEKGDTVIPINVYSCYIIIRRLGFLLHRLFSAQADPSGFIYLDHLHQDLVTLVEFIRHLCYSLVRKLGNMNKTFGPRNNLNKGTEVHDPLDLSTIYLAEFCLGSNIIDNIYRLLGCFSIRSSDIDQSGVIDIDLYPGLLYDAPDHLAARFR